MLIELGCFASEYKLCPINDSVYDRVTCCNMLNDGRCYIVVDHDLAYSVVGPTAHVRDRNEKRSFHARARNEKGAQLQALHLRI